MVRIVLVAAVGFSALMIAEMSATPRLPLAIVSAMFAAVIPPIA